ncbi:MAG TPA: hypothetical protein VK446_05345 [Methylocystis sp.]|nr:hypothetical protein [Methylocystis sp.]
MRRNLLLLGGVVAFALSVSTASGAEPAPAAQCRKGFISKDTGPVLDARGAAIPCFQTNGPSPASAEEPFEINPYYVGAGLLVAGGIGAGVALGTSSHGSNSTPFLPVSP